MSVGKWHDLKTRIHCWTYDPGRCGLFGIRIEDIVEGVRPMTLNSLESFGAALRVIDDVWALVQATGWNSDKSALLRLPDIGVATIAKRAADGRDLLDRIAGDRKSTRLNSSH